MLGTAVVRIFDCNAGKVGLSFSQAFESGFEPIISLVPTMEHATYYPGAKDITLKLISDKNTGKVLGAQAVGTGEIAKRIDIIATAITFGATAEQVANLDLAYAPQFSAAIDPVHHAANVANNKRAGLARGLTAAEVRERLLKEPDTLILDVRNEDEWKTARLKIDNVLFIPLPALRKRINEVPRNRGLIITCQSGVRAYIAERILEANGYENVAFLDGSLKAWPYEIDTSKI